MSSADRTTDADEAYDTEEMKRLRCLTTNQTSERKKMALEVVRGEKKILKELLMLTDVEMEITMSRKSEVGQHVNTKKRKSDGQNQDPSKSRKGR